MSTGECRFESDKFFVFSTWGDPYRWYKVKYVIKCFKDHTKRTVTVYRKDSDAIDSYTTTGALLDVLETSKKYATKVTIFIQDTLLLNIIRKRSRKSDEIMYNIWSNVNKKKRIELKEHIICYIKDAKAFKEVLSRLGKEGENICVILPGIASFRNGACLFNWRGDKCYEVIRGGMLTHALKSLTHDQGKSVGVFLDTSHGVNYFAIALKDTIPLACALYVVKRAFSNDESVQLRLYHYNVQPIIETPSQMKDSQMEDVSTALEIISFDEMGFRRKEREGFGSYFEEIREHVEKSFLNRTFNDAIDFLENRLPWLNEYQENVWEIIAASVLLFARGVLPWALRVAGDLGLRFESLLNLYEKKLNEVEIRFEKKKLMKRGETEYVATYEWGGAPDVETAMLALLAAILREGFESVLSHGSGKEIVSVPEVIDETMKVIQNCGFLNKDVAEKALQLLDKLKEKYMCVSTSKLSEIAGITYPKPFSVIIQTEVNEQFKKYFEVPPKEECCNGSVRILPEDDIVIKCKNVEVYLPRYTDKPEERHFYAHAGLVRGTIFAIIRHIGEYYLLLGPYDPVLRVLKERRGG